MSGKNRRNNNQRQQESDSTIASVQCDGLVSTVRVEFDGKVWIIRWKLLIENVCVGTEKSTLHAVHSSSIRIHTSESVKWMASMKHKMGLGNQQIPTENETFPPYFSSNSPFTPCTDRFLMVFFSNNFRLL